jgi:hypothetical protein
MSHPYQNLPATAFWRTAVAEPPPHKISGLWQPKSRLTRTDSIATFGSCFAQHISRALIARHYNWLDAETAGALDEQARRDRNYGIFSARTGNIYTAAALRQWVDWSTGTRTPPAEIWERDGRYYDPFRPTIEPNGFAAAEEMVTSRNVTLAALREIISRANYFVFTLGLTEAWINRDGGYTYAACPGTSEGGTFDPEKHAFKNYEYPEILADMERAITTMRGVNPDLKVILTVSPVPLTATASGKHVLVATTQSKSILRAVAGRLADTLPYVDYFPSYEIITGAPFRARFYEANLRSVTEKGVNFVMQSFFRALDPDSAEAPKPLSNTLATRARARRADVVCEEEMLEAFAPDSKPEQKPEADAIKICVIGNSHIGTLRRALVERLFLDRKLDFVFWGFPGSEYGKIRFENGRFTHPDKERALAVSGGRYESIDPRDFDVLLFVGGFIPGKKIFALKAAGKPVSPIVAKLLRHQIAKSPAMKLIRSATQVFSGRILLVPRPLQSESAREMDGLAHEHDEDINRACAEIFAEQGVTYLPQPAETIKDRQWTKPEYMGPGSSGHANAKYGAIVLTAVRDWLQSRQQTAAE